MILRSLQSQLANLFARLAKVETTPVITPMTSSGERNWVYIVSSALASLPSPGNRVAPSDAANMPKISSPNTNPAITSAFGAHHYRFVGIEITATHAVRTSTLTNLILLGYDLSNNQATLLVQLPTDIIFDRCYVHGTATGNVRRGINLDAIRGAVIDSYLSDFHEVGADSQALLATNSPGPFKIVNDHLEGAAENVLFGGVDPKITNLVPSDIEFRRNRLFKPLSWKLNDPSYAGIPWSVKNTLEFKNAQRALVEGNVAENMWASGQGGVWLTITPRNQDGTAPWCVTQDLMVRLNKAINVSQGASVAGTDDIQPSQTTRRVQIENNQMAITGITESAGFTKSVFLALSAEGMTDLTVQHNTALITGATGDPTRFGDIDVLPKADRFNYKDNITHHGFYGFFGSGSSDGTPSLDAYFTNYSFTKNGIVAGNTANYPAGNICPADYTAVAFTNYAGGDWSLTAGSPLHNAASDGSDVGANIAAMNAATLHAVDGQWGSEPATYSTGAGTVAEVPRVFIDTTYRAQGGATIVVHSGGDLQAAINSANLGDTIVIDNGATFSGNFTLPAK